MRFPRARAVLVDRDLLAVRASAHNARALGRGNVRALPSLGYRDLPPGAAPFDWLLCDMVWRPLEVAALLAKWGRNQWARTLLSNIKLPMKDKNGILHRVRHVLADGGWRGMTVRQLYHDRDEVTVTARRH